MSAGSDFIVRQTVSYVVGQDSYRIDITVENTAPEGAQGVVVYHSGDCHLQDDDTGFGAEGPGAGSVACSRTANNSPPDRMLQWEPLSEGANYYEDHFSQVDEAVQSGAALPNTLRRATWSRTTARASAGARLCPPAIP